MPRVTLVRRKIYIVGNSSCQCVSVRSPPLPTADVADSLCSRCRPPRPSPHRVRSNCVAVSPRKRSLHWAYSCETTRRGDAFGWSRVATAAQEQGPACVCSVASVAAPHGHCGRMHILCALELRRGHDETATTMHDTFPHPPLKARFETRRDPTIRAGSINPLRLAAASCRET